MSRRWKTRDLSDLKLTESRDFDLKNFWIGFNLMHIPSYFDSIDIFLWFQFFSIFLLKLIDWIDDNLLEIEICQKRLKSLIILKKNKKKFDGIKFIGNVWLGNRDDQTWVSVRRGPNTNTPKSNIEF